MTVNVQLQAPAGFAGGSTVYGISGTIYSVTAAGIVIIPTETGVGQSDVGPLLDAGFTFAGQSTNGLSTQSLSPLNFKNADGTTLAAAAAAGKFGLTNTVGTTVALTSEAANSNTKTDDAVITHVLPANYIAGKNLTLTANVKITGAGTPGTKTFQAKVYKISTLGVASADIGPGATSAITVAGADITAAITGATLNPGDLLQIELEVVLQETAASNITAVINSVRIA